MAISILDNTAYLFEASSNTTAFTCSTGSNRILLLAVRLRDESYITSITYGGQSLTQLRSMANSYNSRLELYYLKNPPTGSNNIYVSFSRTEFSTINVVQLSGVDLDDTFGGYLSSSPYGVSPDGTYSNSITVAKNNSFVLDFIRFGTNSTPSPQSSQTNINSQTQNYQGLANYYKIVNSGSYTTTYKNASSIEDYPIFITQEIKEYISLGSSKFFQLF